MGLGEQIDGFVAAAAGKQNGFGLPPTAIGGGKGKPVRSHAATALAQASGSLAPPSAPVRRRPSPRPSAVRRPGRASICKLAEPAKQIEPAVDRAVPSLGRTQADERQPGDQLLVGRSLNPLVDDRGNHVKVAAAPRSLGKAAEQQPVEPPVAQAKGVRPDGLEAVAGPLDIAAEVSRRAATASCTTPSTRS